MKILVIEDDENVVELFKKILTNHTIISARDGKEGVEKYRTERPDLVLMDIELPKMNGVSATKEIKKIDPNAKIIAVTAYVVQRGKEILKEGAMEVIGKPFRIKDLVAKIESLGKM